jgi:hypothetical protein
MRWHILTDVCERRPLARGLKHAGRMWPSRCVYVARAHLKN